MGFAELGKQKIETTATNTITTNTTATGGFSSLGKTSTSSGKTSTSNKKQLETSEGLLELARQQEGNVPQIAEQIVNPEKGFLGKLSESFKSGLTNTIKVLNIPSNIVAGAIDPNKTVKQAIEEGTLPSDVLVGDIKPETTLGKIGSFAGKLAIDVLTDPLTYLTFGASAPFTFGIRAATKVGGKTLTKSGQEFLQKGIQMGLKGGLSEDFVKQSMAKMLETSPELAKKFVDEGGIKYFGKTILSGQRIKTAIETIPIAKKIDQATEPIRRTVGALFNRDVDAEFGKLPQEFIDLKQKYLDLGNVKQAEAIDKIVDIAKANKLTWQEAEIINSAIETGTVRKLADERLRNVGQLIEQNLGIARKEERARGILKSELDNYVPHILVDEPVKNIPFKPGQTRATLPYAKHRTIKGAIENINADFGKEFFDPNIVRTAAKRMVTSARATTAYDFFRDVASKFGAIAKEAPPNYVETTIKELKGFKFHPAIARQLEGFSKAMISDKATNQLLQTFDKVQNFWKASVTTMFPAFHGRNAISNVFLNYLDIGLNAINPSRHMMAMSLLEKNKQAEKLTRLAYGTGKGAETAKKELSELLSQKILTDRFGNSYTFGELRNLIKNNKVAFSGLYTGLMDIGMDIGEGVERKLGATALKPAEKAVSVAKQAIPVTNEFVGFKAGKAVGSFVEEEARLVNFISNLRKTGDPLLAAQRTNQFLFDYNNLSPFEKSFMKRLIPFYTFTRKNLELQASTLLTAPGRIGAEVKTLTTIGDILGGEKLSEEDKEKLPDWIKQGIGFLAEKKGETVTIFGSLQTPFEQPFMALQPNQLLGSISPILRVPLEQASGYNFFYGKPLSEVDNAAAFRYAPEAIKKFIGFQEITGTRKDGTTFTWYVALNPERMNLLSNLPPTSRVLSTLKQVTNQDVAKEYRILQLLFGIRPYTFDLEREERNREAENRKKLEDLLNKAGVIYKFEITGIPKEKKQQEAGKQKSGGFGSLGK